MNKRFTIGFLTILILVSSVIYITLQGEGVRIRVDKDKTTLYVFEDSRWKVGGREYNKLFEGTHKLYRDVRNIKIYTIVDNTSNTTTIIRETPFKRGALIVDTYYFERNIKDKNLFPLSHTVEILNGSGLIYQYEVRDLVYSGDTHNIENITTMNFGRNVSVEWEDGYYWAKVYKSGILKVRYRIDSDYKLIRVRLFDPDKEGVFKLSKLTAKNMFLKLIDKKADLNEVEAIFKFYCPFEYCYLEDLGEYFKVVRGSKPYKSKYFVYLNGTWQKSDKVGKGHYLIKWKGYKKAEFSYKFDWIPTLKLNRQKYLLDKDYFVEAKHLAWFNADWMYRQEINISNTAGNLTNHQVEINLDSSKVGPHFTWSRNGSDIRFTNSTDDELSFWIESWDSSANTSTIWVKIPFLENNTNTTIYMYYGNPFASSVSNGEATFEFFEDFEGSALNSSKWDTYIVNSSISVANSTLHLHIEDGNSHSARIISKQNFTLHHILEVLNVYKTHKTKNFTSTMAAFIDTINTSSAQNYLKAACPGDMCYGYQCKPGVCGGLSWINIDPTEEHDYKIIWTTQYQGYWCSYACGNGICVGFKEYETPTINLKILLAGDSSSSGGVGGDVYYDTVFVRAFATPEPSVASFGEEENSSIILYLDGTSKDRYYEHGTVANLVAVAADPNATICLDIDQVGYGDNYICDDGSVEYNLTANAVKNKGHIIIDEEASYSCKGDWYSSCSYAVDENWGSYAEAQANKTATIYENISFINFDGQAYWRGSYHAWTSGHPDVYVKVYCYNYTGSQWIEFMIWNASEELTNPVKEVKIPDCCLSSNILQIKTFLHSATGTTAFHARVGYTEGALIQKDNSYMNLTYANAPENKTFYLNFNKYDVIQSAYINLTGYQNPDWPLNTKIYVNNVLVDTIPGYLGQGNQTLNELSNGNIVENLSFNGEGTKVRYLRLPKNANVTSAYLNIKGYEKKILNATGDELGYEQVSYEDNSQTTEPPEQIDFLRQLGNEIGGVPRYSESNGTCACDMRINTSLQYKLDINPGYVLKLHYSFGYFWNWVNPTDIRFKTSIYNYDTGTWETLKDTHITSGTENTAYCVIEEPSIYINSSYSPTGQVKLKIYFHLIDDEITSYACPETINCDDTSLQVAFLFSKFLYNLYANSTNPYIQVANSGGAYEWSWSGEFTENNGTQTVNLNATLINDYLSSCTPDSEGYCNVPILFYSGSAGILEISNIQVNYTYAFNPIRNLNATALQNYLDAQSSSGYYNIPIKISSETNTTIQVSNINITYYGSDNITITAHLQSDPSVNDTHIVKVVYSRFNYSIPVNYGYLEFIPNTPTDKNVSAFGQLEDLPALNITWLNYDQPANLSIKINETHSCINITASTTYNKSAGYVLNTSYIQIDSNKNFLNNTYLYLWADYACNYSEPYWRWWIPEFLLKAVCSSCVKTD